MAAKPGIAIVGAGKLGSALSFALRKAGYGIEILIARPESKSLRRAKQLSARVRSHVVLEPGDVQAAVLWVCVPDGEIARSAERLARSFRGKFAFHSSGALTSGELDPLRKAGVRVASVHPLMTFVEKSHPSLAGVPFAIEGDSGAVRTARAIVRDLGGESYSISKAAKNPYHAWGTFASPLLTALLATTEEVAALAGVKGKTARRRMLPILLQTVKNYGMFGASAGFSGPIIRGDTETVRRHLDVLRRARVPREVYLALMRAALEYLPSKNKRALQRLLNSK